ncbi:MAG: pentapeptide repeat-containing protein [Rhodothermales bacterium]
MDSDPNAKGVGRTPPADYDSEPTFFIEISTAELNRLLEEHRAWVDTAGKSGRRANLERVNLGGLDLHGVNLSEANLYQANLSKANLQGASLSKANLQGSLLGGANLQKASLWETELQSARLSLANLQGANLTQANLFRANLREASLQKANMTRANLQEARLSLANMQGTNLVRANLHNAVLTHAVLHEANLLEANVTGARGLQINQLRGANVSGAELPEGIEKLDWLSHVEAGSRKASQLYLAMLVCCLYSWLGVVSTQDIHLITTTASAPLPIIGTLIPIAGFYLVGPMAVFLLFVFLHLYIQRLWEDLALFPAVFPDGKSVDKKVFPWLMNGLIRSHIPQLEDTPIPFFRLQRLVLLFTAWAVVPLTLLYFMWGYLPRHHGMFTAYHLLLFAASIWLGIAFYKTGATTLRGLKPRPFVWEEARQDQRTRQAAVVLACCAVVWGMLFYGPVELPSVQLASVDLHGQYLRGVSLERANLDGANLRGARLQGAHLERATLFSAQLDNADLTGANLHGADLKGATLLGTILIRSNLTRADLRGANLQGVNLEGATLAGANLSRANLREVEGVTIAELCKARSVLGAEMDAELVGQVTTACVELLMGGQEARPATPER